MSRQLKFRAWDKDYKEMLDNIIIYQGEVYKNTMPVAVSPLNAELMQYVGFKDKHGKEIYEGDILRHTVEIIETDGSVEVAESCYEVLFKMGCFITRTLDGCYPEYETFAERFSIGDGVNRLSDAEIIGNVYENPELLEGDEL